MIFSQNTIMRCVERACWYCRTFRVTGTSDDAHGMHRALFTYKKDLTQRRITPDPPILLVGSGDNDAEAAGVLQTFHPDFGSECVVH